MKRIYTGWYTDWLRRDWTERCRRDLLSGRRNFRFLLPTRHLIQQVRESLTSSGLGISNQIGTFDDMVDLGLSKEERILRIDEQGKLAVLARALEQCDQGALAVFRPIADKPGFLQSLMDAIEEVKTSGISVEEAASWLPTQTALLFKESGSVMSAQTALSFGDQADADSSSDTDAASLGDDCRDIYTDVRDYVHGFATVYRRYQELLHSHPAGRLLDRQEGYRTAAEHLHNHGQELFQGIESVYIDFLTVTPLQFPLVEAICRHVPHVEIFMPYPDRAEGMKVLRQNGNRLIAALRKIGVEHVSLPAAASLKRPADTSNSPEELLAEKHATSEVSDKGASLARLARTVFEEEAERLPASLPVELIPSASPLQEVRAVAKEIKRLAKAGIRPEEMAIVTADDATYRPLLHRVFRENRIAVCLSDIQNLIETPFVRDLIKRMERIVQDGKAGSAANAADFSEKETYAAHAQSVREWAIRQRLTETLYLRAAQGGAYGLSDLRRDMRAWQTCLDSLESLTRAKRLYGDREVRFTRFWSEWKELIRQGKVQVDAGAGVGVQVYRPAEMRGLSYRAVFVLGLNEGRYPQKTGDHWLIERLERAAAGRGHTFQRREQFELQGLLFRYVMQSATDRLYLGYQSPDADERNLLSAYLEAVIRAVQPGDWKTPKRFRSAMSLLPIPDCWDEISSRQEWRERTALWLGGQSSLHVGNEPDTASLKRFEREMLAGGNRLTVKEAEGDKGRTTDGNRKRTSEKGNSEAEFFETTTDTAYWQRFFERLAVEAVRESDSPSPFAGRLQDPAVQSILRQRFGPQYPWSVSALNEYAVCPFKFFAGKVLKVQPKEEREDGISVQDKGIFLHDLNQRLMLPLTQVEQVGEEQARALLDQYDRIFDETCRDWEGTEMADSVYWPAEKERLRKEMRIWLERELGQLVQSRMRPRHLEWSFGNGTQDDQQPADADSIEESIHLQVGGENMRFRGRIDRIDVTEDGAGFVIYDYKTSLTRYNGMKDLLDGTNWQLPVYLAVFSQWRKQRGEQLEPLGGGFLRMSPVAEKRKGVWSQAAGNWGIQDTRKTDLSEDLQAVLEDALTMISEQRTDLREGIFDAKPRVECDPYCRYATVCRFDPEKKGRTS